MTPAWQRREAQRQRILEELYRKTDDLQEFGETPQDFYPQLAEVCLRGLENMRLQQEGRAERVPRTSAHAQIEIFFFAGVWQTLFEFSRSPAEHRALVAMYFENHVVPRVVAPFHRALEEQVRKDPQLLLHAGSAIEEVPLEEE